MLTAQSKPGDQVLVAGNIVIAEVFQQSPPLGNHGDEAPAGMYILPVDSEMIGYLLDSFGKYRYLQIGGACVILVYLVLLGNALPNFTV